MKRTRYTVEMQDGSKKVVLAYIGAEADAYFRARGYHPARVTKGDYRLIAKRREAERSGGYRVDPAALRDACDLLGVRLPVKLVYHSRFGSTRGNHTFLGRSHRIMLKSYLTPQQASETLWHELTHAMQAERAGSLLEWGKVFEKEKGLYQNAPTEIEARRMSRTMADVPLCR